MYLQNCAKINKSIQCVLHPMQTSTMMRNKYPIHWLSHCNRMYPSASLEPWRKSFLGWHMTIDGTFTKSERDLLRFTLARKDLAVTIATPLRSAPYAATDSLSSRCIRNEQHFKHTTFAQAEIEWIWALDYHPPPERWPVQSRTLWLCTCLVVPEDGRTKSSMSCTLHCYQWLFDK